MPNSNTQPIPWGIDPPHVVELPNLLCKLKTYLNQILDR